MDGSGGFITPTTRKQQLIYELHNPHEYTYPQYHCRFFFSRL
ncbi:acyclic terpene utilization AtuA family protein [Acinetobacter silvestris]|uniref:Acyclic terpene utilisation N-terminal domain-containing protein n=1 Tax=Acinetobacter silvestris TaxID=1977882 RepID=A0A1Y3CJY4_9GAMM|nr:hypothetical protein B9T28_04150 [Acinetobacter silvestris]